MNHLDEFGALAVRHSIEKLFKEKFFSICTLDDIIRISGISPNHKAYQQLRAFHCTDYADMDDRTKQLLEQKVIECLRGDNIINPARVMSAVMDEGQDFAFTEDRYIDSPTQKRLN